MARSCSADKLNLQTKPVQEIDINTKDVPKQYIHDQQHNLALDSTVSSGSVPIIDLSLLSSISPEGTEELKKLHSALSSWGCFQATNHSIPHSMLNKLQEVIKLFFQLPANEKKRYSRSNKDTEGYGNDTILYDHQILDWCDRLYLRIFPEDQRKLNVWPEEPPTFRDILYEYCNHLKSVLEIILKAMAKSMNLEEVCFIDQYGEQGIMQARINLYPPCPWNNAVLGLKPHADGSVIAIVLQDTKVEGLQFLKEDQWFKVPIIPDALLINLGDQAEIMTNGTFKSPIHRVVTNSVKERISMAIFCLPDPDNEIQPAKELITRDRKRCYKCVKNYVESYFEYYQEEKRPIDSVRL